MQKKILLAVDDSRHSRNAIHYAVKVSSLAKNLHYVLFHVQPSISLFLQDEAQKSLKARTELDKVLKKNNEAAQKLLVDYRNEMVRMGINPDQIEIITQTRNLGLAKDIIEFAQKRRYDTIMVGRRSLSRLQEMFMGSVTSNILEHSQVLPVWLVDGEVTNTDVMVAIDGSEASLRVIDHVSFMFSKNTDIRLTLLHVTSKARDYCEISLDEEPSAELEEIVARGDKACIDQFYSHAIGKFRDSGISEDQLEMKTIKGGLNTGKAILDEARKGNFGTLVFGRRGANKSFFMGSVSRYIINRASNAVLWIVN
jgi:nucleotide-binding universal stress UspA family protein